jgi:hypothetical protein
MFYNKSVRFSLKTMKTSTAVAYLEEWRIGLTAASPKKEFFYSLIFIGLNLAFTRQC